MRRFRWTIAGLLITSCLIFVCAAVLFSAGRIKAIWSRLDLFTAPTGTPVVIRPGGEANLELPTHVPGTPVSEGDEPAQIYGQGTLTALQQAIVPQLDYFDLAAQLQGKAGISRTISEPVSTRNTGDREAFWATNTDTNQHFRVTAVLQAVTEHTYFWVQEGLAVDQAALDQVAGIFESKIYPTIRDFYGSEWSPGVDGDPHLYILYVGGLGNRLLGYYSPVDEYPSAINPYSNAHELFLLNADKLDFSTAGINGTLAHEFQHMIQWNIDRNEEAWFNEGASELAAYLSGFGQERADDVYLGDPDLQLNDWPVLKSETLPHYRAGFMFLVYFLDRFGEAATKGLMSRPENGLAAIDAELAQIGARDPITGSAINADDFFVDWLLANYLQNTHIEDGRYDYHRYKPTSSPSAAETITSCPSSGLTRDVHQYGADYVQISCQGDYTVHFTGSVETGVVPANPHSGTYAFWSNRQEEADMTLRRSFDFSRTDGPLTLTYWTWYDLEKDYDYLYLESSLDGKHWEMIKTPSGTSDNPTGSNYGWGYNGSSGGWIEQRVDLSSLAGQVVQLRFQYITDGAVNGEGFLLDDLRIPEIGYSSDFENDAGGWEAKGWVRIENSLPQTYRLALIYLGNHPRVEKVSLQADNTTLIPVHKDSSTEDVVLLATGTNRYSRQKAAYEISISVP